LIQLEERLPSPGRRLASAGIALAAWPTPTRPWSLLAERLLSVTNMSVASAPGQHLVVHHAEPDSPEAHALALLGSYTATPASDPAGRADRT
jgi:hypothetical protein